MSKWQNITKEEFSSLIYKHSDSTRLFAKEFGVSKASIFQWMNDGRMPTDMYNRLVDLTEVKDDSKLIILPRGI
jgi:hypothetical protein